MHLQILSDVHLEFRKGQYPHVPRRAPNIALLGDIGKPHSGVYDRFVSDLSRRFDRVIVVAGNHEFYSTSRTKFSVGEIRERIQTVCSRYQNVHYLENGTMFIDGVRILGATLWTYAPPETWSMGKRTMNDYRMTFVETLPEINSGVPLAPNHTCRWHEQTVAWLKEELAAPGYLSVPTIILTHHAPLTEGTSHPKYANSPRECFYSTDLSSMMQSPIVAWAYGHTHFPADFKCNSVRVVSNPLGYPGELPTELTSLFHPPILHVPDTMKAVTTPPPGLSIEQ